jgi:hypothetical protein
LAPVIAARPGARVIGLGERENISLPGVTHIRYPEPQGAGDKTHHYLRGMEASIRRAQNVARSLVDLRSQGFRPDIICCHPGWGEGMFLPDIFPNAKLLHYCEFHFTTAGGDVGFNPAHKVELDEAARTRLLNLPQAPALEAMDWGVSPTHFQRGRYPEVYRRKISVVHEGVNSDVATPLGPHHVKLPDGRVIKRVDEAAPHSVLLVLDATTGQNAVQQVKVFKEMVDVTGLAVTKLDGSAKGGVVVALAQEFGLPVHVIHGSLYFRLTRLLFCHTFYFKC